MSNDREDTLPILDVSSESWSNVFEWLIIWLTVNILRCWLLAQRNKNRFSRQMSTHSRKLLSRQHQQEINTNCQQFCEKTENLLYRIMEICCSFQVLMSREKRNASLVYPCKQTISRSKLSILYF